MALFQPCTAWIKGLFINPTFHSLHLPRCWSLCDGAVHLCVASMLQVNSDLAFDSGSFHTLLFMFGHSLLHRSFFCLTQSNPCHFQRLLLWFQRLDLLSLHSLQGCELFFLFFLPAVGLAPYAMVERYCPQSCSLNGTGKKSELQTLLTFCSQF